MTQSREVMTRSHIRNQDVEHFTYIASAHFCEQYYIISKNSFAKYLFIFFLSTNQRFYFFYPRFFSIDTHTFLYLITINLRIGLLLFRNFCYLVLYLQLLFTFIYKRIIVFYHTC